MCHISGSESLLESHVLVFKFFIKNYPFLKSKMENSEIFLHSNLGHKWNNNRHSNKHCKH